MPCPAAGSIGHAVVHGEHVELRTTDSDAVARWLLTATPAEHLGIETRAVEARLAGALGRLSRAVEQAGD